MDIPSHCQYVTILLVSRNAWYQGLVNHCSFVQQLLVLWEFGKRVHGHTYIPSFSRALLQLIFVPYNKNIQHFNVWRKCATRWRKKARDEGVSRVDSKQNKSIASSPMLLGWRGRGACSDAPHETIAYALISREGVVTSVVPSQSTKRPSWTTFYCGGEGEAGTRIALAPSLSLHLPSANMKLKLPLR